MTYPVIDPTQGVQLNAARTDVAPIWPGSPEWVAAGLRCTLWQFRGAWKYDLDSGIEYLTKVLGFVPDYRVLQEIFREAASKYLEIQTLLVHVENDDEIWIDFLGAQGARLVEPLNILAQPAIEVIVPVAAVANGSDVAIRMSSQLNPEALPSIEDFEVFGPANSVTAVSVYQNIVVLTLAAPAEIGELLRIIYRPGVTPMQGISRVLVDGFEVLAGLSGYLIVDEFGFLTVNGAGFLGVSL